MAATVDEARVHTAALDRHADQIAYLQRQIALRRQELDCLERLLASYQGRPRHQCDPVPTDPLELTAAERERVARAAAGQREARIAMLRQRAAAGKPLQRERRLVETAARAAKEAKR